jgi:hypothetical protein
LFLYGRLLFPLIYLRLRLVRKHFLSWFLPGFPSCLHGARAVFWSRMKDAIIGRAAGREAMERLF